MELRRFWAVGVLVLLAVALSGVAAAGANVDIRDVEAPSFVENGETVRIKATVENTADDEVHQMEVKAKGFDQVKEENLWNMDPGESDTLSFYLEAPEDEEGTHEIQISVQSRDDDGRVIGGEKRNVSIDVGESGAVIRRGEGDLRIKSVSMPGTVLPGESFDIEVTARNTGERDMSRLHVSVTAFGRTVVEESGTLEGDSTRTVPVRISVPAAARGQEEARIEVSTSGNRQDVNTSISISDMHLSMQLRQKEVTVGDHVTVSGILSRRNSRAELLYDGRFESPVFSDETGQFTHTLIPERPGVHRVALVVGTARIEKLLTVEPRLEVHELSVPSSVGVDTFFDVCGLVSRASSGDVALRVLVDDQPRKSSTVTVDRETEHCLSTSIPSEGTHAVTFEVSADGVSATEQANIEVVETGISANVFPDQLTLTRGQAGVFQVKIDNDRIEKRRFDIELEGFQNVSVQNPGTIELGRGDSSTAAVRVVPQETGASSGTIRVSSGDTVLAETPVSVQSVENPALKNPVIGGAARQVSAAAETFRGLGQRQKWGILGGIALLVLLSAWYWRRRRGRVMEPQF